MNENPADLLPELCLLAGAMAGLLCGMFSPRDRQWPAVALCAAGLAAGLVTAAVAAGRPDATAFEAFTLDPVTHATRIIVPAATLLVVALAAGPLRGHPRETEFHVLVVLAALGTIMLGASSDLLVLIAAYLLASIPAYALAGFAKDAPGTEAALKYYLMGALLGVFMLAGATLLYGTGRGTSYAALRDGLAEAPAGAAAVGVVGVLAGLMFKAGIVPAHFWVPDVAEGAPPAVAAFVTTVPKIGAFAALYRFTTEALPAHLLDRPLLLAVVAAATMTLGNLAAFGQDNVRRLLGYSTISQAGYLLVPVAAAGRSGLAETALLFYLAAYAVTNLGAFAVVMAAGRDDLAAYTGLARRCPLLAVSLAVCLLGLVGTPPTAVFLGKVLMFGAAVDGRLAWLAVVAAVNSVASVFYYLRWIGPVFARSAAWEGRLDGRARWLACGAAAGSLVLGVAGGVVLSVG
ncbi:NADH-quinone oxidoreductase subunit N [Actinomadura macrotermitis]|uniref:NADH-quinone oxidoreductase subunit N n=1 Tax=Actinomadura macrotermitis TaxID=2585200 RepID=A0A7K0C372_9ACTN|nr:NADH-quinone oxidoreductase subunit N [Actinomadura macrotermitis]